MKTIVGLICCANFVILAKAECAGEHILITLEDIRNFKPGKNDLLDTPPDDVARLKNLETALATTSTIPSESSKLLISSALRDAIEDLRSRWEIEAIRDWRGPFMGPIFHSM